MNFYNLQALLYLSVSGCWGCLLGADFLYHGQIEESESLLHIVNL